jgi:hypothetical protein
VPTPTASLRALRSLRHHTLEQLPQLIRHQPLNDPHTRSLSNTPNDMTSQRSPRGQRVDVRSRLARLRNETWALSTRSSARCDLREFPNGPLRDSTRMFLCIEITWQKVMLAGATANSRSNTPRAFNSPRDRSHSEKCHDWVPQ